MRHEHRAGEKLFVDFPGKKTIKITDPVTGEITVAELFVAVLGASNYIYAEALPSQELPHWISAHVNAFNFFGGCPEVLVPDYVSGNIIWVLCPTDLCVGELRDDVICGGDRARMAERRHITIRAMPASSGGIRRTARWACYGTPPKYPEAQWIAAPLVWSLC